MKLGRIVLVALLGGAVTAVGATGCSLIVDFDASKIDSGIGTTDAPGDDSADVGADTADTSQPDTNPTETGDDASDAGDTTVADANDAGDTTVADANDAGDTAVADAADTAVADTADTAVADSADTAVADTSDAGDTAVAPVCGNAIVESGEACDLGSSKNGALTCNYGLSNCAVCSSTCTAATPVTSFCSDGKIDTAHETCDDKNTTAGDGCSAACAVETGWNCTGAPSACSPICGDGQVRGSETCDLGANNGKLNCAYGVSTTCTVCSATCTAATPVLSYCGDGKIDATNGETCDDGNSSPSDGCSATCKVESGFQCVSVSLPSTCASTAGDGNVLFASLYHGNSVTSPATETVAGKSYKYFGVQGGGAISSTASYEIYMLAGLGDLTSASVRVWSVTGSATLPAESLVAMTWVDVATVGGTKYAVWKGVVGPQAATQTVYYRVYADDAAKRAVLQSAIPASSTGCALQSTLSQVVCDTDNFSTEDWHFDVP